MREFRISDVELQGIIAPLLRMRLREAGFAMGAPSAEQQPTYMFPINLDVSGAVTVIRGDDGFWTFQQDEMKMAERLEETFLMHGEAFMNRANPPNKGGRT
jgi:hypothetical protein